MVSFPPVNNFEFDCAILIRTLDSLASYLKSGISFKHTEDSGITSSVVLLVGGQAPDAMPYCKYRVAGPIDMARGLSNRNGQMNVVVAAVLLLNLSSLFLLIPLPFILGVA